MTSRLQRLVARDRAEAHRAATPLELLFDLVIVIAIAAAAHGLRHELAHGHVAQGVTRFLMAFFCVWWPWNLFTWFASAFDNDDPAYRVNVMTIMFGAMFVAASMPGFFEHQTLTYTYVGYVIMRLATAALWMRAGRANPEFSVTALRYGVGQILLQVLWAFVVFALEPGSTLFVACFAIAAAMELFTPWFAEHAQPTQWHRHHIGERFGLLNIIVLGEVLLGSTDALEASFGQTFTASTLVLPISGSVIAFSMWWLYFTRAEHLRDHDVRHAFIWAYGHFAVFASVAAAGAGLGVMLDTQGQEPTVVASLSVSIPVATYVAGLWLVRERYVLKAAQSWSLIVFSILIAATGLLPYGPAPTALLLAATVFVRLRCAN